MKHLFEYNQSWAKKRLKNDPNAFSKLSDKQTPKYLWVGCSDSRIPANQILGLEPGEVFVHRNVANIFPNTDFNCLSVLEYGVVYLGIEHVIVCGHYGCGGVACAMKSDQFGLVDNWLRNIRDVCWREKEQLASIKDEKLKYDRVVELNVLHQVMNICHTTIIQNAWAKGKKISVHGWVYDLETGLLKDLDCCVSSIGQVDEVYHTQKLH